MTGLRPKATALLKHTEEDLLGLLIVGQQGFQSIFAYNLASRANCSSSPVSTAEP